MKEIFFWKLLKNDHIKGLMILLSLFSLSYSSSGSSFEPASTTLYTYQSGVWSNPDVWTTDPGGTTLVGSRVPSAGDAIVVLPSRTLTLDSDITNTGLDIFINGGGILDLNVYQFTLTLSNLSGQGTIRLASVNFPSSTINSLVSSGGGTVEYYNNADFNLPAALATYNNLTINCSGFTATQLCNIVLYGNLIVKNGTYQINNTSANIRNLTVTGNIDIENGASLTVGSGAVLHNIILNGNLVNKGILDLTNNADFASNTGGAANISFSGTANSLTTINGTTSFYGFIIDKGTDQSVIVEIASDVASSPFDGNNNSNVITLKNGTLKLDENITVSRLRTDASNYDLSTDQNGNAGLWINGANVTLGTTAMVVYGNLKISMGSFNAMGVGQGAIVTREGGSLWIEGGSLTANQIRPSSTATHNGSFILTGGTVNVNGPATENNYPVFSWPYSTSQFRMSGGILNISSPTTAGTAINGGILIGVAPENFSVTGGTVNVTIPASAINFNINSTVPFWNLNIYKAGAGAGTVTLSAQPHNVVGLTSPVAARALIILNNLFINGTNNPSLNAGGQSISVKRNFIISSGGTYDPGNNRTIFNGSSDQTFTNSGTITSGLYRFYVEKSSGTVTLGSNITVRDSLAIFEGVLNDGGFTLQVAGNIYNAGTHTGSGKIQLNGGGSGFQTLTASESVTAILGNLEINSSTSNPISAQLGSDFSVNSLSMISARIFKIGAYKISVGAGGLVCATPSSLKMIQTDGLSSNKGLELFISLTGSYIASIVAVFPIGVSGKYTPMNVRVDGSPGTVSGKLRVVPVNICHPASDCNTSKTLQYHWKTYSSSGLSAALSSTIKFTFTYSAAPVGPKALFLNSDGTWNDVTGGIAGNSINFPNDFTTTGIGFQTNDFTSGNPSNFNKVNTYYSVKSGNFNDAAVWSNTGHTSGGGAGVPGSADRVIIGGQTGTLTAPRTVSNDSITVPVGYAVNVASININTSYTNNYRSPVLNIQSTTGHTIDIITGGGKFCTSTTTIPVSDYGEFLNSETAVFNYFGTNYTLPSSITSYPNLLITGGNTKVLPAATVIVRKNLIIADGVNANNALSLGTSGDLTVFGDLQLRNGGKLLVPLSATVRNINIYGDINFTYGNNNNANAIEAVPGAGTTHKLNFFGNNIFSGASNLSFNPAGTNKIDLYIKDSGTTTITNGTGTFSLNKLYINKDLVTDMVYFKNNFTLNETGNNTSAKSLNLGVGTLVLSDPANGIASTINLNLSSGGTNYFIIPSTSALRLRNGASVNISGVTSGSGILLDGLLMAEDAAQIDLANSTATKTGYIEYSGSGNAVLNLSGSSVLKAAQIRRSLSITSGIINYSQSGTSAVTIYGVGTIGIIDPSRAKLEVTGTGSSFNMSGTASISIINGGGTTYGDLYLQPENSTVSGGEILFGTGTNSQTFKMVAGMALYNLSLNTNGIANTINLMSNPLVLNGNLSLNNTNSIFNSNNINVTVKGNFTNNGTYNPGTNNTIFTGNIQTLAGSSLSTFYNLTVSPITSLTLSQNILVNKDIAVNSGSSLISTSYNVEVRGSVINNGIVSNNPNPATNKLYLHGNVLQHITGTGTFGRIELNNSFGARLSNNITLTEELTITLGIFNINQYLLTLGVNSSIQGSGFGDNKMIMPDGVFSNIGIKKYFNAGYSGTFIFPIGSSGKYTPATLIVNATSAGFLRINTINDKHPATLLPYNVMNYFWEAESSVTGFQGTLTYNYLPSDVVGTESSYVAARLIVPPGTNWSKAATGSATDNVDEATRIITFDFPAGTDNLGGQFTAGEDASIPNLIPVYTSNVVLGNWNDPASWTPVAPAGGPNGCSVLILSGHTIVSNGNKRFSYNTVINGTLDIGTTYGHNLGTVSGTGTLKIDGPNIPAGRFDSFFSCTGGSLEFSGTTNYTIIADRLDVIRNLYFTGAGIRTLPDKDLVVCNQLQINGPTVDNSVNNRKLTIGGAFNLISGQFLSGSGVNATVEFNGIASQSISGFNTGSGSPLNNFQINNSTGMTLNSVIEINGNLLLTSGVINTSSANLLKMINQSINTFVTPSGGSSSSFVNGPMTKYLFSGSNFIFPVGKSTRFGKLQLLNVQNKTWQAEYYNSQYSNISVTGTLSKISGTEYWKIISPADATTAMLQLRWDTQSDISPTTTTNGIDDIRVVEFNGTAWAEKTSGTPSGDNNNGTVQTTVNIPINNTGNPQYYALGSVSLCKPTITIGTGPSVCLGQTSTSLPYTSTSGTPNQYSIDYTSALFTDVAWTALTASPIALSIPAGAPAAQYSATVWVRASGSPSNISPPYSFTITVTQPPSSTISYTGSPWCSNVAVRNVTLTGTSGGIYTAPAGLSINSSTGAITPAASTAGTYTVTYTIAAAGGCGVFTSTTSVTISALPVATFSYSGTPYCSDASNPTPTFSGSGVAGIFSASAGLNFISTVTGQIDLGTSTPGTYTVTNTIAASGGCSAITATSLVTITILPTASISYTGSPWCTNAGMKSVTLTGTTGGSFSSTAGLAVNSSTGSINPLTSTPGIYTVSYSISAAGGCSTVTATTTIEIDANFYWLGAISTDWNVAGNWSCGGVPGANSVVTIPNVVNKPVMGSGTTASVNNLTVDLGSSLTNDGGTLVISGSITINGTLTSTTGSIQMSGTTAQVLGANVFAGNTIKNLIINNNAGVSLLGPINVTGSVLVSSGNLASDGNLILVSNATGTALIDGAGAGAITGNVTMQRYMADGFGYKYFSSPMQGAKIAQFGDDMMALTSSNLYKYVEDRPASGWVTYSSIDSLIRPLRGYAVNFGNQHDPRTVDITAPVNNGDLAITLKNNSRPVTNGFHLIGNPYPSPIDWDIVVAGSTNIDLAAYFFKASATAQYGGTYSSYVNGVSTGGTSLDIIQSMQGFFAHVTNGTTGVLRMTNAARLVNFSQPFVAKKGGAKAMSAKGSPPAQLKLSLRYSDDIVYADPMVLYIDDKGTPDFEGDVDALKLLNTDLQMPNIYSVASNGAIMSINAIPPINQDFTQFPLGIKLNRTAGGTVIFKLEEIDPLLAGMRVFLNDINTGALQDLFPNQEYTITLPKGEYLNRFYLNFSNSVTSKMDYETDKDIFKVYSSAGILKAEVNRIFGDNGTIAVFNLTGQKLFIEKIYYSGYHEFNTNLKDGIYIVNYSSGSYSVSRKLFIERR